MTYFPQRRNIYGAVDMIESTHPDVFKRLDDVYIAATSKASKWFNPQGYENKLVCLDYFKRDLPPQTPDIQALVATSQDDRERTLNRRASDAQRQRNRTARKAEAAGRKVRSYRKRK